VSGRVPASLRLRRPQRSGSEQARGSVTVRRRRPCGPRPRG
jgi:hypothetical protein